MTDDPQVGSSPEGAAGAEPVSAVPVPRLAWRFEPWLVLVILVLDQGTKALIRAYLPLHETYPVIAGVFNLTYVQNTGAAFGLLNDIDFAYKQFVVAAFAAAALGGIALFASTLQRQEVIARTGLAFILGGAAGNLIDRVTTGAVVDFVDVVFGSWHFWAFNVADAAITAGVCAMFLDMFGLGRHVSQAS
jgi:signal peptidase II